MKKLMTMIAAVGMAFGLFADGFVSGTNFNGMAVGEFTGNEETGLWTGIPLTGNQNKIVKVAWSPTIDDMIPEEYKEAEAGNSLAVKTTLGTPITRSCGDTAISGDAYVDMMAQFTVFDETPDFTATGYADSKIALWLQESTNTTGDVTGTNVWLYAGKFGGTADSYNCGAVSKYKLGDWNRVTIKSIANIGTDMQAFVVFINGIPLEMAEGAYNVGTLPAGATASATVWYNQRKLFPTIVNEQTVSSVSFDGQGGIDDIVFATNAGDGYRDFAVDPAAYTISWNTALMTDVKTNGVSVGAATSPITVAGTPAYPFTISWTGKGGKASGSKEFTEGTTFAVTETDLDDAEAEFNTIPWKFEDAIAEANKANGTLKILADEVGAITLTGNFETTIDLNGKTVMQGTTDAAAIAAVGAITITGTGTVEGNGLTEGDYTACAVACWEAACTIEGGTFNAAVSGEDIVYKGGEFLKIANPEQPTSAVEGYEFVEKNGYWVLEKIKTYALSVATPITGGTVEINPVAGDYAAGTPVTVTATPNTGYSLKAITLNDAEVAENTFNMPANNVEVSAVFTANVYKVTYTYTDGTDPVEVTANGNPMTFTFGVGATFDAALLEYDKTAYENPVFEPTSIGAGVTGDQPVTVTFTKKASDPVDPQDLPDDIDPDDAKIVQDKAKALIDGGEATAQEVASATKKAAAGEELTTKEQQIINSLLLQSDTLVAADATVKAASITIADGKVTVTVEGVKCTLPEKTTIGYLTVKHAAEVGSDTYKAVKRIEVTTEGVGTATAMDAGDDAGFYKAEFEWKKPVFEEAE